MGEDVLWHKAFLSLLGSDLAALELFLKVGVPPRGDGAARAPPPSAALTVPWGPDSAGAGRCGR